ncbi:hypothetical protein [Allosphingosinicella sp.]|uniref:hypothetical protein n=1 Tax=Allosphingosinicella sp. TaxID=2823234 RepID=UPI003D704074
MKRILMTAAALTLGTSALAWTPASAGVQADNAKFQSLTYNEAAGALSAMAAAAGEAKAPTWVEASKLASKHEDVAKPGLAWLDLDKPAGTAEIATASLKKDVEFAASKTDVAMGGPYEPVTASLEGYPPCRPGAGDDRCIQLYEPGVREEVAQWKSGAEAAMGGPYQPADAAPTGKPAADDQAVDHSAMGHGDEAAAAAAAGKPVAPEATPADKPAAPEQLAPGAVKPTGVGGPLEAAADYPACRPGPGDDRCIQLYERGVAVRRK